MDGTVSASEPAATAAAGPFAALPPPLSDAALPARFGDDVASDAGLPARTFPHAFARLAGPVVQLFPDICSVGLVGGNFQPHPANTPAPHKRPGGPKNRGHFHVMLSRSVRPRCPGFCLLFRHICAGGQGELSASKTCSKTSNVPTGATSICRFRCFGVFIIPGTREQLNRTFELCYYQFLVNVETS